MLLNIVIEEDPDPKNQRQSALKKKIYIRLPVVKISKGKITWCSRLQTEDLVQQ